MRQRLLHAGKPSLFGFHDINPLDLARVVLYVAVLAFPLWFIVSNCFSAIQRREYRRVARELLFLFAALVSAFGMFSNGELKDVEWSVWIAVDAVLLFGTRAAAVRSRRFYLAFFAAIVFSDLYMGAVRYRVFSTGPHMYFEWNDSNQSPGVPFFRNLKASTRFNNVVDQVGETLKTNPQPVFFGPRMEFAYAAFGLPSPRHIPLFWTPGDFLREKERARNASRLAG